jgi:hypothetical protein
LGTKQPLPISSNKIKWQQTITKENDNAFSSKFQSKPTNENMAVSSKLLQIK